MAWTQLKDISYGPVRGTGMDEIGASEHSSVSPSSAIQSLAEKQGVPSSAIAALDTTGYRLERGRLCFLEKQIFLHLVYTNDGREFSVYLRPRSSLLRRSVHQAFVAAEDLAFFESDRLTAVFVAHQPGANVLAFARAGARVL
jgi:hypothetical protein